MPSNLPKYSGLITEEQLQLLHQFVEKHEGLSKARALGALLQAWDEAGQPILDLSKLDIKSQTIAEIVAREVNNYLSAHLSELVNNLVKNHLTQTGKEIESLAHNLNPLESTLVNNLNKNLTEQDNNLVNDLDTNLERNLDNNLVHNSDKNLKEDNNIVSTSDNNLESNSQTSVNSPNHHLGEDGFLVSTLNNNLDNNLDKDQGLVDNLDGNLNKDQIMVNNHNDNLDDNSNSSSLVSNSNSALGNKDDSHSVNDSVEVDQSEEIKQKLAEFKKDKGEKISVGDLTQILSMRRQYLTRLAKKERKKLPFPDFWDYLECNIKPPKKKGGKSIYEWIIK